MQIEYVDYIPGTNSPARVFHQSGIIQINLSRWNHLPEFTKKFILAHEEGHYLGRTNNEFAADNYAFQKLALTEPHSLRNSIKALSDVLPFTTPEHTARVKAQLIRSLAADWIVNKNADALKALYEMQGPNREQFVKTISRLNAASFEGEQASIDRKAVLAVAAILIILIAITYFTVRKS